MLRLRLVISAVSAVSVDPLPDQRLSLVLMQVSDLALLRLRPVASGLLLFRRVASASVPLRRRALPVPVSFRHRRLTSVLRKP